MDLSRFLALRRVTAVVPSPDAAWLAVAAEEVDPESGRWIAHLWRVELPGGGPAVRLTDGPWRHEAPCFRHDGVLGFLSDRPVEGGTEPADHSQIWLLSPDLHPLTDEPLGVSAFAFAAAAPGLVALAPVLAGVPREAQRDALAERGKRGTSALRFTRQPTRRWNTWWGPDGPHLFHLGPAGTEPRDLTPAVGDGLRDGAWDLDPTGRWLAYTRARIGSDRQLDRPIILRDLCTDAEQELGSVPRVSHEALVWSPDGQRLAALRHTRRDNGHGPKELWCYDAMRGEGRALCPGLDLWLEPTGWTADGRRVVGVAPQPEEHPIFAVDVDEGPPIRLTAESSRGTHEAVRAAGPLLVGIRHTLTQPPTPFVLSVASKGVPRLLSDVAGLGEQGAPPSLRVGHHRTPVPDGHSVHWILVRPPPGTAPLPVALLVHGGPVSQWADAWHWRYNPLLFTAAGLAVALPNPRGSTGHGQSWVDGIFGNRWGAECYRDLLAVADDLARVDDLDPSRVGVLGGSFGGYMTNWIGSQTDRFRCLVTHASIYASSQMYGDCDTPAEWAWHLGSTPYDDLSVHDRYSPHRFVHQWRTPTLIVHGERDYCVPVSQGLALFEALQLHGVECELLVFPDEGHWIERPGNIAAWYDAVVGYLTGALHRD